MTVEVDRSSGRRGRSRVALGSIAAGLLIVSMGCGADYRSLSPGECLPSSAKVVGRREADPPTTSCEGPHRYEVFAVGRLTGDEFPGQEQLDADSRMLCYEAFEPSVGFPAAEMGDEIRVVYLAPTEQSWTRDDDREVECLLIFTEDREGRVATPLNGDDSG